MKIATRGSNLALTQTRYVSSLLSEHGYLVSEHIVKTDGDRFTDRPLHQVSSGVGAFVRELDDVMLKCGIELAVHSMKDMPTIRPKELVTAAVLKRDSPYDVLLTNYDDPVSIDELPENAVIGTSSLRRKAQILRYRPDIVIKELRGNIDTRIRKLREGQYDGIILAEAGLDRMGWTDIKRSQMDTKHFCPSANQGTVAVVALAGTEGVNAASKLDDYYTRIETATERHLISKLDGGCTTPIASFAKFNEDKTEISVTAEVLSFDGTRFVRIDDVIPLENWEENAIKLGEKLAEDGGKELAEEALIYLGKKIKS
ncbi:MAG: hydroxymethylbilane synthase [Methanosarcinaceae archaeon]|nr:hydroxymethylbilane synthase [Methanosarcinaceae archaeon]